MNSLLGTLVLWIYWPSFMASGAMPGEHPAKLLCTPLYILYGTLFSLTEAIDIKGTAHRKNENLYFLAPAHNN